MWVFVAAEGSEVTPLSKTPRCLMRRKQIPNTILRVVVRSWQKQSGDFQFLPFPKGVTLRQQWGGGKEVEMEKTDKSNWKNKISSPCFNRFFSPQQHGLRSSCCWGGRFSAFTSTFRSQGDLLWAQSRAGPNPSYPHRTNQILVLL